MKIVKSFPPNIEKIRNKFDLIGHSVIFTYGDTIYSPHSDNLPDHLIHHEEIHTKQQGTNPEEWWGRYLLEDNFRLEQEVAAYKAQYYFVAANLSRQERRDFLKLLAKTLSSKIYGSIVSFNQAKFLIL